MFFALTPRNLTYSYAFPPKISNIGQYLSQKSISVLTGSKYIAIKDEWLQILECLRLGKNNVPELTDLLRYWPMFEMFGRRAL